MGAGFTFFLVLTGLLYGGAGFYDPILLKIQANIYPRVMTLDRELEEKNPDGPVTLLVLHALEDLPAAEEIARGVEEKYLGLLDGLPFQVAVLAYRALEPETPASAFYLLSADEADMEKALEIARTRRLLTFSYEEKELERGVCVSSHVGSKIRPYVNVAAIRESGVRIDPTLYRVSKIYRNE